MEKCGGFLRAAAHPKQDSLAGQPLFAAGAKTVPGRMWPRIRRSRESVVFRLLRKLATIRPKRRCVDSHAGESDDLGIAQIVENFQANAVAVINHPLVAMRQRPRQKEQLAVMIIGPVERPGGKWRHDRLAGLGLPVRRGHLQAELL